jgi:hypothetical protein
MLNRGNKQKMEYPIGNIAGDFEYVETTCPRCNSNQVSIAADSDGYFFIKECYKCGFKNLNLDLDIAI